MRIASRVVKLERRHHRLVARAEMAKRSGPCEVCGAGGAEGTDGERRIQWRVVFESDMTVGDAASDARDTSDATDHCRACGRRRVYRVRFDQAG